MYLIFKESGRLGNAIFRYLASCILCEKFGLKYILYDDIYYLGQDDFITITDSNFLEYLNKDDDYVMKKHVVLYEFYQFDVTYLLYKPEIFRFIDRTKIENHYIKVDGYGGGKRYNFNDILYKNYTEDEGAKTYDVVIHLRLGDVFLNKHIDYISYEYFEKVYEKIDFCKYRNVCMLVENKTNYIEMEVINQHLSWFRERNIEIELESNNILIDFYIMKSAKVFVCSFSTIDWCAAYLSNTIELCYMPNCNLYENRKYTYFKIPIYNTILYDTSLTKFKNYKVIVKLDKDKKEEKDEKEIKKIYNNLHTFYRLGLKTDFCEKNKLDYYINKYPYYNYIVIDYDRVSNIDSEKESRLYNLLVSLESKDDGDNKDIIVLDDIYILPKNYFNIL